MATEIKAFQANDGTLHRSRHAAEMHDAMVSYVRKKERVMDAVESIQRLLPEDHITRPHRKGGDAWRDQMSSLVMDYWPFLRLIHEHWDEVAEVMEK